MTILKIASVPVLSNEELLGLSVGPIRRQEASDGEEANERVYLPHKRHLRAELAPVVEQVVDHLPLDDGPHVEDVYEHELIGLPGERVLELRLHETVADAREGRAKLDDEAAQDVVVALVFVSRRPEADERHDVVEHERFAECSKVNVEVDLRDDLEDEEAEIAEHEEVAHFGSSVGHVCHEVCVVVAAIERCDCAVCAVDAAKNCQVPEHFLATWKFLVSL